MEKNCSYELNINGNVVSFTNEIDLDNFILNNKSTLQYGNVNDVIFSSINKQQETLSLLNQNSEKAITIKKLRANEITGDIEIEGVENYKEYEGVTKRIKGLKQPGTDTFIFTPFNLDDYIKNTPGKLMADRLREGVMMTLQEATLEVKKNVADWKVMAEMGTELHSIAEEFFKGNENVHDLIKLFPNVEQVKLTNLISQLHKFKEELYRRHGTDAKFLSEYVISNDEMKLLGIIDLIVVDNQGQAHIYDFKTSYKSSGDWYNVKNQTNDYQLGFYRHMLAAQGIPMKKAYLGIVPINMVDGDWDNRTYQDIIIEETQDRQSRQNLRPGLVNHLEWGTGKYFHVINSYIPINANTKVVSTNFIDNINDTLTKAFPVYEFKLKKTINDKKWFMDNRVKISNNPKFYKQFRNTITGELVYAKDEDHLNQLVDDYMIKSSENLSSEIEKLVTAVSKVIEGKEQPNTLAFAWSTDIDYFPQKMEKYIGVDWELLEIPEFIRMGIIPIQNKSKGYIDFLSFTVNNLSDVKYNLGKGTTVLGGFKSDDHYYGNEQVLEATAGNIELMKIMTVINELTDVFNGNLKIGNIITFNPNFAQSNYVAPDKLEYSFDRLTKFAGIENNIKKEGLEHLNNIDMFLETIEGAIADNPNNSHFNTVKNVFEKKAISIESKIEDLLEIQKVLLNSFPNLKRGDINKANITRPENALLVFIDRQILNLQDIKYHQPIADMKRNNISTGSVWNNPDTQRDPNVRLMGQLVNIGLRNVGHKTLKWDEDFRKIVHEFKKGAGYGSFNENMIGAQNYLYRNLFETNSDGEFSSDFHFKNENDKSLKPHEKVFLSKVLFLINKARFNLNDESDPRIIDIKAKGRWYEVPLTKASGQSRFQNKSAHKDRVKRTLDFIMNPKKMKQYAVRAVDETLNEEAQRLVEYQREYFEMIDRFDISEDNRAKILNEHPLSYFETNVEDLTRMITISKIKKQEMDKVLPSVRSLLTVIKYDAANYGIDVENFSKHMEEFLSAGLFNLSIIEQEMKPVFQFVKTIKFAASKLMLGFNYRSGLREILQGAWRNIGTSIIKQYGENQFGFEEYLKAVQLIIGDVPNFVEDIHLIESLNVEYAMANMDVNALNERLTSNKKGIFATNSRFMFWMSAAPDYMNRMSMFIAQMIKDGSWEAHTFENGEMKYDWKKDKRFSEYAANNTSHPEYDIQKQLYLRTLRELNFEMKLDVPLKAGDDLPKAYTSKERDSLKSLADMIYGYYDQIDKATMNNLFMGSLWLQFRTFFSATKHRYWLDRNVYNQGKWSQMVDDEGNKLYETIVEDANGELSKKFTLDEYTDGVKNEPAIHWEGRIMEGIIQSFSQTFKEFSSAGYGVNGLKRAYDLVTNDPVKLTNFKWAITDLLMFLMFSVLMASLVYNMQKDRRSADKLISKDKIDHFQDGLQEVLESALIGSTDDFFVGNVVWMTAFDWQPPAFRLMKRISDDAGSVLIGDKDLSKVIINNVSVLRSNRHILYDLIDDED